MATIAIVILVIFAIYYIAFKKAVEGWEDADGFHYGKQVKK